MAISPVTSSIITATVLPISKTATREVATAVQRLNQNGLAGPGREFSIAIDAQTKVPVVRIVESDTRKLIEQIPSQYILDLAHQIDQETASNPDISGR